MLDRSQRKPKRKLKVDLRALEWAFEDASGAATTCLDTETGEIITLTDDIHGTLEDLYAEIGDVDEARWEVAFDEALKGRNLPAWEQNALREADRVEAGFGTRYIRVPTDDSREGYADMEAFIETVRSERLQAQLWRASSGRGAFRYFKDVLADHPRERERWFAFKQARLRERGLHWLDSEGIEAIEGSELENP